MRTRSGHRRSPIADLDVTAFINLMVVLVAFFLSSVTYFQFSSLELKIPPAAEDAANPGQNLALEITIRKDALEIGDRNSGLIRRIDNTAGAYDYKALNEFLRQIKSRFPDKTEATILAEANIPYDVLIKTMDATRTYVMANPGKIAYAELFPDLSIGDAPAAATVKVAP
jgi:biopolymer transport protein ExbD